MIVTRGKVSLLLVGASLVLSACGKSQSQTSDSFSDGTAGIIGGQPVLANSKDATDQAISQSTVAIYDTQQQTLCTGSILSDSIVITAGHCADTQNPRAMVLIFGNQLPVKGGPAPVLRQVVDLRLNPRYEQVSQMFEKNNKLDPDTVKEWGDVSVLKFVGGLPPGYSAAHLLAPNIQLKSGMAVTLAGYGEINGVQHIGSNELRRVDVVIADGNFSPSEVMLDQRNGKGACHGDSGGPAYVNVQGRLLLFGVTSRGIKDPQNNCGSFSIYTNIMAWSKFLSPAIADLLKSPIPPARPQQTPPAQQHPRAGSFVAAE